MRMSSEYHVIDANNGWMSTVDTFVVRIPSKITPSIPHATTIAILDIPWPVLKQSYRLH